ncbi:MAG: agmatine deiminase family protein [Planctomycetes bacterium]|nr:agmatine deiminase family protein [Planctomycetota bacterium]
MNLITRSLVPALAALLVATAPALANDFISTNTSDWYRYRNAQSNQEVTSRIVQDLGGWRLWDQFGGMGQTWVYTGDDHDWTYIWNGQTYSLIGNLSGATGQSRSIDLPPCLTGSATIAQRGVSLTTPAGTFLDCTELRFQGGNCADAGVTSIWFAKDVGIVRWSEQNFVGEQTYELSAAQVDGRQITGAPAPTTTTPAASSHAVAPAEHERMESILWGCADTYLVLDTYEDALAGLAGSGVMSDVTVGTQGVASQLRYDLVQANVPLDDVEIYVADLDTVWMRDYGPVILRDGAGNRSVADLEYYPGRDNDDAFPAAYANWRGWSVTDVRVGYEGGNFMTDGRTTMMCSTGVQRFNRDLSRSQIEREFGKFGYGQVEWFRPLIDEGTTHVDMFMRIMDDGKALVSRYPSSHRQSVVCDEATRKLQDLGYQVTRVDADYAYDEYATFSNSVLANGIALVPQYDNAAKNRAALRAYESLGYTAVGIRSKLIIRYSGATHCVAMQIPTGN